MKREKVVRPLGFRVQVGFCFQIGDHVHFKANGRTQSRDSFMVLGREFNEYVGGNAEKRYMLRLEMGAETRWFYECELEAAT